MQNILIVFRMISFILGLIQMAEKHGAPGSGAQKKLAVAGGVKDAFFALAESADPEGQWKDVEETVDDLIDLIAGLLF